MAGASGKRIMSDPSIPLAFCSLVIYGATQVIAKQVVRSMNATSMVAINFLVSIPIYVAILISALVFVDWGEIHFEYVVFAIIGASTARGGYYLYLESLEKGSVTMVGSITAAFPAITALLTITILGERLGVINALGIAMVISCMVALSYSHGRSARESSLPRTALLLSIAVLLIWGFGGVFIKLALDEMPLIAYLAVYPIILPPIALTYLRHRRATKEIIFPKWSVPVVGAIVVVELWQLGYFAETGAVSSGVAAIVYPLISAYPVVTIAGAHFFLKEKVSLTDWVLLGLVLLGIMLASAV